MKFSLLDKLACPHDHEFPLGIDVQEDVSGTGSGPTCELHCARFSSDLVKNPVDPLSCRDCRSIEIETATLTCPVCETTYSVTDGIPHMLAVNAAAGRPEVDKNNEIQARDEQAGDYDSLRMLKLLSRLEVPALLGMLGVGKEDFVVELGAGTGRLTSQVAPVAGEVAAFDFSIESLMRSREKCTSGNVHWVQADINRLPLRDLAADRVFSCQVFEHLPGATMRNMAVDEAARVLKASGNFVISVYRDSWIWRLTGPKEGYHPGGIYYYRMNMGEFRQMLGRQFTIKRILPNLGLYLQMAKCTKNAL